MLLPIALVFAAQLASQELTEDPPRVFLWPAVTWGTRLDTGVQAGGALALSVRVTDWFEPEMLASAGAWGSPVTGAVEVVDRFSFGARLAYPIDIARPFLWIALHHEHQTSLAALKREPVAAIFGLSHVGVVHLTGAEAAMGMSIPIAWDNAHFELFTRAGVVALPSFGAHGARDQVALFMDIGTGLPLSF